MFGLALCDVELDGGSPPPMLIALGLSSVCESSERAEPALARLPDGVPGREFELGAR